LPADFLQRFDLLAGSAQVGLDFGQLQARLLMELRLATLITAQLVRGERQCLDFLLQFEPGALQDFDSLVGLVEIGQSISQ